MTSMNIRTKRLTEAKMKKLMVIMMIELASRAVPMVLSKNTLES
jgi:hypothetical protein